MQAATQSKPLVLPVNIDPDNFFNTYLAILNPILNLRKGEAKVLEAFIRLYYINRNHPRVNQLLFSRAGLKTLRESLNMSISSFNIYKFRLRQKELIFKDSISPLLTSSLPQGGKMTISFIINLVVTPKPKK